MISHLHFSYILLIPIQSLSLSREGRLVEWLETTGKSPVRSYLAGNAGSRLISEAKQPWACLVLGWGTTGEAHVLYSPYSILFHWFSFPWGGPEPALGGDGENCFALCVFPCRFLVLCFLYLWMCCLADSTILCCIFSCFQYLRSWIYYLFQALLLFCVVFTFTIDQANVL